MAMSGDKSKKENRQTREKMKSFMAGVQVNGQTIHSFLKASSSYRDAIVRILAENQIADPQPGLWYSQQAWLNAFRAIAEEIGPDALYAIGRNIPDSADWPDDIDTLEKALASIDIAYHMNHKGGAIGHYLFEKKAEGAGIMVCNEPYPCDFDRGIIEAVAAKFSTKFQLTHEDETCRKTGAACCAYQLSW
jgi:hypothetical protein